MAHSCSSILTDTDKQRLASSSYSSPVHLPEGESGFPVALLFAFGFKAPTSPIQTWEQGVAAAQRLAFVVTNTALNNNNKENRESQAVLLQAAGH